MDIQKILAGLREEREQIEDAIAALERIARQRAPRRGRPPKWLTVASKTAASANSPILDHATLKAKN
jgi:hypothetical protein